MKKKKIIISVIVIAVLVSAFLVIRGFHNRSKDAPEYQLAEMKRGDLEILVSSTGTLNALETVAVGAEVSGTIKEVYVDFNDKVKKGDLLALVDPTVFEASVKDAQAAVMKAEAMLEKAKAEYDRNKALSDKGYISVFDLLTLKTTLESAEADLISAKARLTQSENNLANTKIRSPISGTVIQRSVDAGQTIASSFQAPELFIIAEDLKKMQLNADVDENDIGQIKKDQRVRFTVQAYPNLIFDGAVRQVRLQPETIQNVVTYTVVIDVSNDKGLLLPGMTATIDFIILDHKNVLLVPNSALSFKPPAPEKTSEKGGLFSNLTNSAHGQESPPVPSKREIAEGKAQVFYLTEGKYPRAAFFTPGESDGVFTEVIGSADLKEGMKLITGVSIQGNKKPSIAKHSLLPTPGRGPGR
jgi:HlyD family secretion protein